MQLSRSEFAAVLLNELLGEQDVVQQALALPRILGVEIKTVASDPEGLTAESARLMADLWRRELKVRFANAEQTVWAFRRVAEAPSLRAGDPDRLSFEYLVVVLAG